MTSLSEGYASTLDLLDKDQTEEAKGAFKRSVLLNVKKLYSEVAETYPVRYSKIEDWCAWSRQLYILTRKTDMALDAGDAAKARELLQGIRQHFYNLHQLTGMSKASDHIYSFFNALEANPPSFDKLKTEWDTLENAEPSLLAKSKPDEFKQTIEAWRQQVGLVLQGGSLTPEQINQLRAATEALYKAYGLQFE